LFIDLLSSRVNDLLKLSERSRIGRLFWPIVSTIGLSGFHIIVLTLQESPVIADKPARRESMAKIAPIPHENKLQTS